MPKRQFRIALIAVLATLTLLGSVAGWWATLSFLTQIKDGTGLDFSEGAYTKYELRLIVGINF